MGWKWFYPKTYSILYTPPHAFLSIHTATHQDICTQQEGMYKNNWKIIENVTLKVYVHLQWRNGTEYKGQRNLQKVWQ